MSTRVDMSVLIHFLLQNGWDYTQLPRALQSVSRRELQRAWHKRVHPTHAVNTDHVALAILEADPPTKRQKKR